MTFWDRKKPCTQHLWPFGKVHPFHQASSPPKYLLPALLSPKQQQPPLLFGGIKSFPWQSHVPWEWEHGIETSPVQDYSHISVKVPKPPGWVRATTSSPVGLPGDGVMATCPKPTRFSGGVDTPRKHRYKAASTYKMFWSFFCYSEQQDIESRPF